jgi:hypothetical protein
MPILLEPQAMAQSKEDCAFNTAPAPSSEPPRSLSGEIRDALWAAARFWASRIYPDPRRRAHRAVDSGDVGRTLQSFDLPYDVPYLLRAARAGAATRGECTLVMDLIGRYGGDGMGALISPNELAVLQRCAGPGWISAAPGSSSGSGSA